MGTPPPTALQTQTTLEIETETPPQLQTNPMVAASSPFAVIQEHYRRLLRFACMEVVRAIIGLSVGALLTYLFLKNKK
ncbi:transmembrane protein, putative [Medicago truncatula]|uniref:Transmembrane protein, putative n=1 Tax=Medicago truncatula TaxID=3880 RepID=G7JWA4_MEDTR|nr:transmembrane protein, putative [Medicago truncatula]